MGSAMRRASLVLIVGTILSAIAAFAQPIPQPPGAPPQKPLRERLLERALKGDSEAQFDLGKNYEAGRIGLPKDFVQAEHWYRLAAEQGDPFAQASLGILLGFGKGIPKNEVQALMWYEVAVARSKGGDRDTIVEMRDDLAARMSPKAVAEARQMAQIWVPKK